MCFDKDAYRKWPNLSPLVKVILSPVKFLPLKPGESVASKTTGQGMKFWRINNRAQKHRKF